MIRVRLVVAGLLLCVGYGLATATPALAVNRTWDGGGGVADTNWMTAANWVGNVAPSPGDSLIFPDSVSQLTSVNNFPPGTAFSTISFTGSGYTISGNAIELSSGTTGIVSTIASGSNTLGLPITVTGDGQS